MLEGKGLDELPMPPTGVVASRIYPPHYDRLVEEPAPDAGRFADKKVVLLRRDPRDVAVSLYYSLAYSHGPPAITETEMAIQRKGTRAKFESRRAALQGLEVEEAIMAHTARPAIRQFLATSRFMERHPRTCLTTYETLTTDFPTWLAQVSACMDWTDDDTARVGAGLEAAVQPPSQVDPYQHKRRVTPGNWREVFDRRLCKLFQRKLGALLTEAGYEW